MNGRAPQCRVYIAAELSADGSAQTRIATLVGDLDAFDVQARGILQERLKSEDAVVVDFLDIHLEECEQAIKEKIGAPTVDREGLLASLDLRSVGFHPGEHLGADGMEMWLDYCPGEEFSDELLVVKFRADGQFVEVAHES